MFIEARLNEDYPRLSTLSAPIATAERRVVGRQEEMTQLQAAMARPELCNALLLGPAGAGKSMVVYGVAEHDSERVYREIDPSRVYNDAGDGERMAAMLKDLFVEAENFVKKEERELVLFIDEVHQLVQLSPPSVEALKPVLAASGRRGIRIIGATTDEEFHQFLAPNLPLVERLQRINLSPPDLETTREILLGMAERYGVVDQFYDDDIFRKICEYTEQYQPASVQPRKSILVLDAMIGWHRLTGEAMDTDLLARVMYNSAGVNVGLKVDGTGIKARLDERVFSQDLATTQLARRLQLSVADLNDKTRPQASFLFAGSTGVGKATTVSTPVPVWTQDGSMSWKRAGDLVPGDQIFARDGSPEDVLGVFPQGEREVFRVTLGDGRHLDVSGDHLWSVRPTNHHSEEGARWRTWTTKEILERGVLIDKSTTSTTRRGTPRYAIPMNEPVRWPERKFDINPYTVGALIGDGCLTSPTLAVSSKDEWIVAKVAAGVGAAGYERMSEKNYSWQFRLDPERHATGPTRKWMKTRHALTGSAARLVGHDSFGKRIPLEYLTASIEQRWELVQGLFDTDGSIGGRNSSGGRMNVTYATASNELAQDVRTLLLSLGVDARIRSSVRPSWPDRQGGSRLERTEYTVYAGVDDETKTLFFSLPRKVERAAEAASSQRKKVKRRDQVPIVDIESLNRREDMVCVYVAHPEHLYQAGDFIVTHNTELTKQLARLIFGDDQRHLIRFDMTEFANEDSVEVFRSELTKKVFTLPFSVILLDEIEKAHSKVTRVLLQVLDDGRLTDDNNREVSFRNAYVVMTSNAGADVFHSIAHYSPDDQGRAEALRKYDKLIHRALTKTTGDNRFPVELVGRIDAIVPFQPLSRNTQRKVVEGKLRELTEMVLTKHGVKLVLDRKILQYLVEDKGDVDAAAGGARQAVKLVTEEVATAVATFINEHSQERRIRVDVVGDLVSDHKDIRVSDAHLEVSAMR